MKTWISKWLIFVAAGHTVVGIILFGDTYREMITNGLLSSVNSLETALASWFLLFGFLLFIASLLIAVIEKDDALEIPKLIGVMLLILTTIGVVLMPASGFWLVYPAAIAILVKKQKVIKII
ncbi:MAG: DUF6463 family protein [Xanthomonadales bacterium]|nr:DUF6463 family protein [Xanthomonadales bacterium]